MTTPFPPPSTPPGTSAPTVGLRRSLGLLQATALVVGIIIGASIFVQPSEIMRDAPSVTGILLVWLAAGLLTAAGALICAELASAWPESGGVYVYLRRTLSPAVGFLWAWAMFWSMHTGIIAAIGMVFGRYVAWFLPWGDAAVRPLAIAAILLVSGVNYVGVQHGGRLQAAFTVGKVVAIAAMIAVAFALGAPAAPPATNGAGAATSGAPASSAAGGLASFLRAVAAGLFAFGGWHMVTYTAGETRDAARTIPRALVLGIAVVVACYIALNAAYLHVLPLETVVASTRVAADAADAVLGSGGAAFMSALVGFSAFGALAGLVLAGPRVYHAMAEDGLLFRWVAEIHPRFRTPHRAIALQALWACVLVATGTYRELFTRVIYTEWLFFALLAVGLVRARRRAGGRGRRGDGDRGDGDDATPTRATPTGVGAGRARGRVGCDYAPAYRVWGYPLVPALFIAGSLGVVVNQVALDPLDSVTGLGLVLLGLPVYYLREARRADHRRP